MRNFNIDLQRIIFAAFIVVGHLSVMKLIPEVVMGPLVVLFFLFTGYFTMSSIERRKDEPLSVGSFLYSKLMSFLPYLLVAGIVTFVLQTILQVEYYGYELGESLVTSLLSFFADVSCLDMFSMTAIRGNVAVWYLSGMMAGLAITYPLLLKFGHSFSKHVAPIVGVFCIAISLTFTGTLFGPYDGIGGVSKGFLESIGSICLGYFSYECVVKLRTIRFTKTGRIVLSVIELGCYVLSVAMMLGWSALYTGHLVGYFSREWYEFGACFLVFIAGSLTCSGITYLAIDVSDRPILKKMSAVFATGSLALYLANYYQIYYVTKMFKSSTVDEKILISIAFVAVSTLIIYFGGKVMMKAGRFLKTKMVVQEETA